jgi:spore coat polysaccharide biosynthesis protein SpsF (cytidylyltransferase family)
MHQELIARTVAERQVQLRQDTEKLLALAAELKQHVDKTRPNILSLDVIKKAQQIEKLAKSVREKMRDAY